MTIRKGTPWGRQISPPENLVIIDGDAALASRLRSESGGPESPIAAGSGDMARTLGVSRIDGRSTLNELPIDLLDVRVGDDESNLRALTACAHVVMRPPWWRGGWWRDRVVVVMNAEFIGSWDVAPRGHPNDGRAEVFEVGAAFGARQRLTARRRVHTGSHVPHPAISTRSIRTGVWSFDRPVTVIVDGQRVGPARHVEIDVIADAATVLA